MLVLVTQVIFAEFPQSRRNEVMTVKIRELGNQLTILAEELIIREHQTIHRLLGLIRNSLLLVLPLIRYSIT